MFGYFGAALFTMLLGIMVTKVGYNPLFVALAIFDIVAALLVWNVARPVKAVPNEPTLSGTPATA